MIAFIKKALVVLAISNIVLIPIAKADDAVTLNKNEKAPFTGTLLSPDAVAKILASDQISQEQCKIETEKQVALVGAQAKYDLAIESAKTQSCKDVLSQTIKLNDNYIKDLEKEVTNVRTRTNLSFIGGVLSGIGITVVSAWAISKVAE